MTTSSAGSQSSSPCADGRLREAFAAGKLLQLHPDGRLREVGGGRPDIWVIHAGVIQDLLLSEPVPGRIHQVSVCEADIQGELDLRFAKTECILRLEHCTFHAPVRLSEAHLQYVSFRNSTIPEIDARHLTVAGDLVLEEVEVAGQVRLDGAHLGDDLHLAGATIGSPDHPPGGRAPAPNGDDAAALDLRNIDIKGSIDADRLTVRGELRTEAATVGGTARMTNMHLRNPHYRAPGHRVAQDAMAWDGDGMTVEGILDASGLRAKGQVRLIDAQVLCLVLSAARITSTSNALMLDRLNSRGSVYIDQGRLVGGIHAIAALIGASLYLRSSLVRAPASGTIGGEEHALDLRRAKISGDLRCEEGFKARGVCDLTGAYLAGRVALTGAHLRPANGRAGEAFTADGAQLGGALYGENGFTIQGTMSMINAQVGGDFSIEQDSKEPCGGLSLVGTGLAVARNVNLNLAGAVDLSGATINGDLMLRLERLDNGKDKAAADLSDVKAGVLSLYGRPTSGFLDLGRASVSRLLINPADWPEGSKIVLDGLAYSAIAANSGIGDEGQKEPDWLTWLETGTQWVRSTAGNYSNHRFIPQPYQHLAGLYHQSGDDRKARNVLHAMYCRHNKARVEFWHQPLVKTWNVVQDIFLGYGYVPWRAVAWLTMLTIAATGWFLYFGQNRPGIIQSALLSLGLVLPGSGYDKLAPWKGGTDVGHLIAAALVMCGLLLGASVIAALGRAIKR